MGNDQIQSVTTGMCWFMEKLKKTFQKKKKSKFKILVELKLKIDL